MSTLDQAIAYIAMGWALCSIDYGTKGPKTPGWNKTGAFIDTREAAISSFNRNPENGIGLIHGPSGTCAIDIDDVECFMRILAEFAIDGEALLAGAPRIIGREGRDKAIFRVPENFELGRRSLAWPAMTSGGKPITVFELRAGDVQDVLPPTIHPDTHQPYRWRTGTEPFGREIPMLPAQLLAIWQAWDSFKPQLMAICPWAPKDSARLTPAPRVHAVSADHGNVIGQFNQAHDLRAMLEAHGYQRRGKRYLAPTSSTMLAGVVVFEDGAHCYSHHASDPLNDGHAHDAFDLFCIFEHGGDVSRAIRAAAELLGVDRPVAPLIDMAPIIRAAQARQKTLDEIPAPPPVVVEDQAGIPGELLRVPGVLGEFCDHIVASSIKPQRVLAVNAALSLGAILMARIYAGTTDLRTNLYLIGSAPSTAGKDHGRRAIKAALNAIGKISLLGGEDIKSGGAVLTRAALTPACLFQLDEFGLLLQAVASPKANGFQAEILVNLMKLYSSANSVVIGSEHADQRHRERVDIQYPCVCVHGTTTPDTLWEAIGSKLVLSGFLNRFVLTHSEAPDARRQKPAVRVSDVPERVIAWSSAIADVRAKQSGNLHGVAPESPIIVGVTREAETMLDAFADEADAEVIELAGAGVSALWGRAYEIALKVAMIVAGSLNPAEPRITAESAGWAIQFVRFWTRRVIEDARQRIVDPEFASQYAAVKGVLEKFGHAAAGRRQIGQFWRGWARLRKHEQDAIMDTMVANGDAFRINRKGQRGPATEAWVARQFAPEAMVSDVEEGAEENQCLRV